MFCSFMLPPGPKRCLKVYILLVFVTINHWKLRLKLKVNNLPSHPIFQPLIARPVAVLESSLCPFTVSLPSHNAVRCRQLLCRSSLADLYKQFYGRQPGSWWSVICLGYLVTHGARQFTSSDEKRRTLNAILRQLYLSLSLSHTHTHTHTTYFNPLNAELNRICHLLALLGAHLILHVSGLRVTLSANPRLRLPAVFSNEMLLISQFHPQVNHVKTISCLLKGTN